MPLKLLRRRLFATAAALALVAGAVPAVAQTASGAAATYADPFGNRQPAGVTNVVGRENGTGAQCLVGSDTTCQLPGSGGGGGSSGFTGTATSPSTAFGSVITPDGYVSPSAAAVKAQLQHILGPIK